jgi:nucleoside-diphosphate-sugar epimerase
MTTVEYLLTGVTGFVGRFVLRELLERTPQASIAVIIRASGNKTAVQRFQELTNTSLFGGFDLSHIQVIDAALENIEKTTVFLGEAQRIIHCAANVKHFDPYEALERDNVENVRRILGLAERLKCRHLSLLSTCYVHPRSSGPERRPERIPTTPRADFYNDYCYTKWMGEEVVWTAKTTVPHIEILRLACVGAPQRRDLAAHPCPAQAHLGILTLLLRGYVQALAVRPTARLSVIPVDVVAAAILDSDPQDALVIQQLAPPPSAIAYHLSLPVLASAIRDLGAGAGVVTSTATIRIQSDSRAGALSWPAWAAAWMTADGRKSLELHRNVQDFISTFTDDDLRFESSVTAEDAWRPYTDQEFVSETLAYAIRIHHDRVLKKGVPMPILDRFWTRVGSGDSVQVVYTLKKPVAKDEWTAKTKNEIWSVLSSRRKYMAEAKDGYWKSSTQLRMDAYIGEPMALPADPPATLLERGLQTPPPEGLWYLQPFEDGGTITHILLRFDHGMEDGVGALSLFADFDQCFAPETSPVLPTISSTPRSLPFWLDLWMGVVYLALLVVVWNTRVDTVPRSAVATVSTTSVAFHKPKGGGSHTANLVWALTRALAQTTRRHDFVLAVPAVTEVDRSPTDLAKNAFVPLLLPVDASMSEEALSARCRLLHAKSVRFLSWCLLQIVERLKLTGVEAHLLGRVDAILSSLTSNGAGADTMSSVHVTTTTPAPIPLSVVALTVGSEVHLTVRSHTPTITAGSIQTLLENTLKSIIQ